MREGRCPHGLWGGSNCSVCDNDPPSYREAEEAINRIKDRIKELDAKLIADGVEVIKHEEKEV